MIKLKQAVIVEGKYDKAKLSSLVDATIVTTDGFDVFRDREKLAYIRALAEKNGIIILTDSDAAGFRIRAHIAGTVDPGRITHVYIPDILGKERRKAQPSAEGKLGVEGMPSDVLLDALRRAGVAIEGESPAQAGNGAPVTKSDLVEWGLSGGQDSAERRRRALQKLGLPARMNANAMLSAVNALYTRDEFRAFIEAL